MLDRQTKRNSWLVVALLAAVLLLLPLLSFFIPAEGVRVASVTFRFARLDDYLTFWADSPTDTVRQPSAEELVSMRVMEMKAARESGFVDFFSNNAARIRFPIAQKHLVDTLSGLDTIVYVTDYGYFDDFYMALDSAVDRSVNVIHYGDSQIEEDRITSSIRSSLQSRFGGGGVGLLPFKHTYYNMTVSEQLEGNAERYSPISYDRTDQRMSNVYGPMLQAVVPSTPLSLRVFPRRGVDINSQHRFNSVVVVTGKAKFDINVDNNEKRRVEQKDIAFTRFVLPDTATTVTVNVSGSGDLYGVSLQCTTGVSVDNVPLRGCSGTLFTRISGNELSRYFEYQNTRLIIMEFGGNAMPALSSRRAVTQYVKRLVENARKLSEMAPQAKILFVGPSDMVEPGSGTMRTYPMLPVMDSIACAQFTEAGFAYWSMFEAMGGAGSMQRWVAASPKLAAADYVHFTRQGAKQIGAMLSDAIMMGYDFYKLRGIDAAKLSVMFDTDTISPDSLDIDSLALKQIEQMTGTFNPATSE